MRLSSCHLLACAISIALANGIAVGTQHLLKPRRLVKLRHAIDQTLPFTMPQMVNQLMNSCLVAKSQSKIPNAITKDKLGSKSPVIIMVTSDAGAGFPRNISIAESKQVLLLYMEDRAALEPNQ